MGEAGLMEIMRVVDDLVCTRRVPGARERAVTRCKRVRTAIESRYARLYEQGLLHCQMAVSDTEGSERCAFVEDDAQLAAH
jgi:hypothetical protein